jgi:hypothetical protein
LNSASCTVSEVIHITCYLYISGRVIFCEPSSACGLYPLVERRDIRTGRKTFDEGYARDIVHVLSACFSKTSCIFDPPEVSPVSERVVYLRDDQWREIDPFYSQGCQSAQKTAAPEPAAGWYVRGFRGYSRAVHDGRIFRTGVRMLQSVGVG